MKKLLKSENCGSREQCTRPIDVLKMTEKSKFSATVHVQYMNSKLVSNYVCKKKKKKGIRRHRIRRIQTGTNISYMFPKIKDVLELISMI